MIQSLGGDTKKSAELSNQAIIDMSDNANKMGTDMSMIQNAYQGFAKQNYTMLDNLKLGYGGTKSEMERLLKDAEKISGKKFDISNFARLEYSPFG
jgi:phage-related protein